MYEKPKNANPAYMEFGLEIAETMMNNFSGAEQNEIVSVIRNTICNRRHEQIKKASEEIKAFEELNAKLS